MKTNQKMKSNNNSNNLNNEEDKLGRSTKIVVGRILAGDSDERMRFNLFYFIFNEF